jgi:predicted nucleotide-binding protein
VTADIFISYARTDRKFAESIVAALAASGLQVWWDAALLPGQAFDAQIRNVLQDAKVVLGVLSPMSLRSQWVISELTYAHANGIRIVPVLVSGARPEDLPVPFNTIQALVLDEAHPDASAREIALKLTALLRTMGGQPPPGTAEARRRLASAAAETARQASSTPTQTKTPEPPRSIFVVHGHDEDMLDAVTAELESLGITPVVLKRVRTSDNHLFAKFMAIAGDAKHAIVLISGDDVGAAFRDYAHPAGGMARLEFRARQNVILELGYFYGKLGEEHVFVFRKPPPVCDKVVNRLEEPSDLAGKIFEDFSGDWKAVLSERLKEVGFHIPGAE